MKKIIAFACISILCTEFSANLNISEGTGTHNKMPDITVDETGTIHIIWINNDNNKNILYTNSSDHGNTWAEDVPVGNISKFNLYPEVATSDLGRPTWR